MTKTDEYNIGWNFDNSYVRLPETFYTSQKPTPVNSPKQVLLNRALALSLGLNIGSLESETGTAELSGNRLPAGAYPIAQAYAGHQFGYFTMLGDGRALLLGEQINPNGERFDIQLKGSGRTPYSRGGDGRAALGPMLREYIISEAMHALGIPTTRSLSVVITGDPVYRETVLPGAVLTRVAASHIRVGTFQYASKWTTVAELKILADYTIHRHFPEYDNTENKYLNFLKEAVRRQAILIAKWQLVGFIHGVMNTDNMALSGETIDYGPCAFMDTYDPETVFSSIDYQGRYAYGNQPNIAAWNLAQFADTLLPLLHSDHMKAVELAQNTISDFAKIYYSYWLTGMRAKLGLTAGENEDTILIEDLLKLMHMYRADYTNTFLALTFNRSDNTALFNSTEFTEWHRKWKMRLDREPDKGESAVQLMKNSNPAVIPRNHRVEEALDAAVKNKDYSVMECLLKVLSKPYAHTPDQAEYAAMPAVSSCSYKTFCGT
ncbi:MAG: protein adenylyltransferase SelO [Eubacteriales bacterium]